MSHVWTITGANRGIGLELARQAVEGGDTVCACSRGNDTDDLEALAKANEGRVHMITMDVASDDSVASAARAIGERVDRVDVLINNAGTYPRDAGGVESLDLDAMRKGFEVNTLGPLRVTRALLPLLRKGSVKTVLNVTSLMGSIDDNSSGGSYAYRTSKTALNMVSRNLGHELGGEGFSVVTVHPGWVQTRMGGGGAPLSVEESARGIKALAEKAGAAENGGFRSWDHRVLAW